MKYKKWTFTTVPNIQYLEWKNPILQVIYMWICKYSNEDWYCYPSQKKLAENCWVAKNSLKKYLKELEDLWLLVRNRRFNNNEEISSTYQLLIPEYDGGGSTGDLGGSTDAYGTKTTELNHWTKYSPNGEETCVSGYSWDNNTLLDPYTENTEVLEKRKKVPQKKEKEYWNEDINNLIENIKEECRSFGIQYNWEKERMFAKHILSAKQFWADAENYQMDRCTFALNVIRASMKTDFWAWKIAGPKDIYRQYPKVINEYNNTKNKNKSTPSKDNTAVL